MFITIGSIVAMLLLLLASGVYIAVALGWASVFGLEVLTSHGAMVGCQMFNPLRTFVLLAVPLFMFMGEIILHSGLANRLYNGVSKWTSIIPGGLLHSNIISCSIFAAVSGSSVATAATIGTVAYPEQSKRGYAPLLITGSLAGGGTLGLLIPPSITMILFGAITGTSVGKLFMGGVIPGIILALLFMAYIFAVSVLKPSLVPQRQRVNRRYFIEGMKALRDVLPVGLIIVLIMAAIYGGVMTPTEAAAAAGVLAIILAAIFGKMNFTVLKKSAHSAVLTSGMIYFLVIGCYLFGGAMAVLKIPTQVCDVMVRSGLGPHAIWFLVVLMLIILGCFMDGTAIMLIVLPVLWPLMKSLGFHPLVFGIMMVLQDECSVITPPVGLNLFVIFGISQLTDINVVIKGVLPYFLLLLLMVAVILYFPQIVLFLPAQM